MQRRVIQRKAKSKPQAKPSKVKIPEGGGRALGADQQQRMEEELGADLSGVKIHDSGDSANAANQLGARAFTVGQDIHFNDGEFKPGTLDGDRLLAHELAHTVQGQRGGVQRKATAGAGDLDGVSHPDDACEKEADAAADHAIGGLHGGGRAAGKPTIGTAAPSVGRKLFGSKKSDPAPAAAAPGGAQAGGAQAAAPGGKAAPAAAGPTPAANAASGLSPEAQKQKKEEVDKQRQLLKQHVALAAKEAEVIQKAVNLLAAAAQDIITLITGPLGAGAGIIIKSILSIVQGGANMFLDINREMDIIVQGKLIDQMAPEQLEEYCTKWQKDEPSMTEIKEQLGKGEEEIKEQENSGDKEKPKAGIAETASKNKFATAMQAKGAVGMVSAGANVVKAAGGEQIKQGVVGKITGMIPGFNTLVGIGSLIKSCYDVAKMRKQITALETELGIAPEAPAGGVPPPGEHTKGFV
jgi:hypothetical protein